MKRTDIVMLLGAKLCNPNGDPDLDNRPRTLPDTGKGIISKGCIARKIRNFVQSKYGGESGYDIYVKENTVLGQTRLDVLKESGVEVDSKGKENTKGKEKLLERFFDLRTFGGVLTGSATVNCGQVRGPVQITVFESVDPVTVLDMGITRCAAETPKEKEASKDGISKTMGSVRMVNYGLYKGIVSVNPILARQTGFSERDLEVLVDALSNMFSVDSSTARPSGSMTVEKIVYYEHESEYGNAQTARLGKLVKAVSTKEIPDSAEDYEISVSEELPIGIQVLDNLPCKEKQT